MKRGLPLLLVLILSARGRFQINIQINPQPTRTLPPQATLTADILATAYPIAPTHTVTLPSLPTNCSPLLGWSSIKIQVSDTLESIAALYNTTVDELIHANCLATEELIPGTLLYVPGAPPTEAKISCGPPPDWVLYKVQPGDTLYHISLVFGVSLAELQLANCMGDSDLIRAG
jgi:LysM repeat protein